MCIVAGLVGGEAFSIDASLIKADVDKTKRIPGDQPFAWPKAEEASQPRSGHASEEGLPGKSSYSCHPALRSPSSMGAYSMLQYFGRCPSEAASQR